jgi:uncharacterized membrane protein
MNEYPRRVDWWRVAVLLIAGMLSAIIMFGVIWLMATALGGV